MGADRRTLKRALRWLAIAVIAGFAVQFVRRLDPAQALRVVAGASVGWVLLAMVVNATVRMGTRVMRTRSLLTALPGTVPLRELVKFVYGAAALGYVVSPIAGSAARVFALQQHGVPSESVVAVQLWEKVVSGCALALFAAPMLARDLPARAHYALAVATVVGAVGLVVAMVLSEGVRRLTRTVAVPTTPVRRWLFDLGRALALLHSARTLAATFLWSVLSELADVVMLALALHAVGAPVDAAACVLAFIVVNVGSALPSTPGQLGVFEATAAWGLVAAGVADERALAAGLIYHLVHVVPVFVLGLPALVRLRAERREAAVSGS
ncbi:MAG: lysylphosphatidylglycerol synthase transmembrane domain-containing protein [Kofleriaceae bacterium]